MVTRRYGRQVSAWLLENVRSAKCDELKNKAGKRYAWLFTRCFKGRRCHVQYDAPCRATLEQSRATDPASSPAWAPCADQQAVLVAAVQTRSGRSWPPASPWGGHRRARKTVLVPAFQPSVGACP